MSISPLLSHEKERKAKTPDFLKNSSHNHKAFTLIELLIVIAIIGVLSTLAIIALNSSRAGARDSKRLSDLRQVRTALELYYADNDTYPLSLTPGQPIIDDDGTVYMSAVPSNPSPRTDGTCPNDEYTYQSNGTAYGFFTCLGAAAGTLFAGGVVATANGVENSYPVIKGTATTKIDSNSSSHDVNLPSDIKAGDLLVIFYLVGDTDATVNTPSGWTQLAIRFSAGTGVIFYKIATGSEGATQTITLTASVRSASVSYLISNFSPSTPIVGVFASSGTVDPPNLDPGFGNANILWIAMAGLRQASENAFTTAPTNYTGFITLQGGVVVASNNTARIAVAHRFLKASSENPGAFAFSGTSFAPRAATVAIKSKSFLTGE